MNLEYDSETETDSETNSDINIKLVEFLESIGLPFMGNKIEDYYKNYWLLDIIRGANRVRKSKNI